MSCNYSTERGKRILIVYRWQVRIVKANVGLVPLPNLFIMSLVRAFLAGPKLALEPVRFTLSL